MKRSIEDTPIVFIGAGNLATNLAKALYHKGFRIVQVYSRTMESARTLAEKVEAEYTTDLHKTAGILINRIVYIHITQIRHRKQTRHIGIIHQMMISKTIYLECIDFTIFRMIIHRIFL